MINAPCRQPFSLSCGSNHTWPGWLINIRHVICHAINRDEANKNNYDLFPKLEPMNNKGNGKFVAEGPKIESSGYGYKIFPHLSAVVSFLGGTLLYM